MILMATHDVCVWLYVKLTPYPLSHDLMGSIGWVGHGGTGPLNFARGGRTVTEVSPHFVECSFFSTIGTQDVRLRERSERRFF